MAEKNIEFSGGYTEFKYEYLVADELRLNQIFINLLTNAAKYTGIGGKVRMDIYEEDISDDDGRIILVGRITDNGIGMTEDFQKTMYDSFTRAENGRECIDIMHREPVGTFDLILMDIQMPVMNDREVIIALRYISAISPKPP